MLMRFKQICLSLACMIILLHAIIPHHHHSDKPVCFHELFHQFSHNHHNCCETDGHENHNHDFDKGNCIIDDYFAPKDDYETIAMTMAMANDVIFLDFIFNILPTDFILNENGNIFRRSDQTIIYKNPLATNNFALRAPPTC